MSATLDCEYSSNRPSVAAGFTMHEFAQKNQFLCGVVFSLTSLALSLAVIALIAINPHVNIPSEGTKGGALSENLIVDVSQEKTSKLTAVPLSEASLPGRQSSLRVAGALWPLLRGVAPRQPFQHLYEE